MERLFTAVQLMLPRVKGALYIAVLFVSTIFAAATGIVGASVTILGILMPPSIMLVVMGSILEVPVIDLFATAIIPGFMMAMLYVGYALVRCQINPSLGSVLPE